MPELLTVGEFSRTMETLNDKIDSGFNGLTSEFNGLSSRVEALEKRRFDADDEDEHPRRRKVRASDADPLTRRDLNVALGVATAVVAFFKWVLPMLQKMGTS